MSAESPFDTNLPAFEPIPLNIQEYLTVEMGVFAKRADRFVADRSKGQINALNGIARRAITAAYSPGNTGWRHVSHHIYDPDEVQLASKGYLSRMFRLAENNEHTSYRFFVNLDFDAVEIPFVQLVKPLGKSRYATNLGGPYFVWDPDGSNESVRILNPENGQSVGANQAGVCAIQGLAKVYFDKYYSGYFIE